jgi:adenylate kinase
MKKIICLYGPPGGGKTTQVDLLATRYNFSKFGMGERLRAEIASGSSLGKSIKPYIDQGRLIPDKFMKQIIKEAEKISNQTGLVFDGFPRIISQAKMLDETISPLGLRVNAFIYLFLSPKTASKRIKNRVEISKDREDDYNEEAIRNRFSIFEKQNSSLLDFYRQKNLLIEINGELSIEEVHQKIITQLNL